jgi:hypothetical protein
MRVFKRMYPRLASFSGFPLGVGGARFAAVSPPTGCSAAASGCRLLIDACLSQLRERLVGLLLLLQRLLEQLDR